MKILLFIASFSWLIAGAQVNTHFEDWINAGDYDEPEGWVTPNIYATVGGSVSCNRSVGHWGKYGVAISPIFLPTFNDTIPGYLFQQGAINKRLNSVSIYYRYPSMQGDSAVVLVSFYKGSIDTAHSIGQGDLWLTHQNNWTKLQTNIIWKTGETPDSFVIYIGGGFRDKRDTVFVDDLELSQFKTGLADIPSGTETIFLNSNHQLVIRNFSETQSGNLTIRNMLGEEVYSQIPNTETVSLRFLPRGLYVCEWKTEAEVSVQKFTLY